MRSDFMTVVDDRQRRLVDDLDHAVRRARLLRRRGEQPRRVGAAGLGHRVREMTMALRVRSARIAL